MRKWSLETAKKYVLVGGVGLKMCSAVDYLKNVHKLTVDDVVKEEEERKKKM